MKNIVLIGMPASGKSTVGQRLAKNINRRFVDTDSLIRQRTNEPLSETIAREGAEGFIKIEEDVVCGLNAENSVIATGGSVVYGERAMAHLKDISVVVYLKADMDRLRQRMGGGLTGRGVVMRGDCKNLEDLYAERTPLYEKYADLTVDCSSLSMAATVGAVMTVTKMVYSP